MWNLESYHFTFERLLFSRGNRNQLYCSKDQNSIFIRKSLTSLFTRVGNSGTASSGAGQTAAPGSPPALEPWVPCAPVHQADSVVLNTSLPGHWAHTHCSWNACCHPRAWELSAQRCPSWPERPSILWASCVPVTRHTFLPGRGPEAAPQQTLTELRRVLTGRQSLCL